MLYKMQCHVKRAIRLQLSRPICKRVTTKQTQVYIAYCSDQGCTCMPEVIRMYKFKYNKCNELHNRGTIHHVEITIKKTSAQKVSSFNNAHEDVAKKTNIPLELTNETVDILSTKS